MGDVANLRKEIEASQVDRTKLTLTFNSKIKSFCKSNSITFVDLDRDTLGTNGVLKNEYYSKDYLDHHYDLSAFRRLILKRFPLII